MWIIVATVLLLYLLGFLFICFLNTESHGNPSSSDNNSLSASNNNDETANFCERHHFSHRLFLNRLISSNLRSDEEEGRDTSQAREANSDRLCQQSSDLSRSALFAYRQQQLRQIHHEINEMSYLLGANQAHSDRRSLSSPVPIRSRGSLVQPLRSGRNGRNSNYLSLCDSGGGNSSQYSFVHQLMFPLPSYSPSQSPCVTTALTDPPTARDNIDAISDHGTDANNLASRNSVATSSTSASGTDNSFAYQSSASPSLSYSPGGSESCYIIQERQRRLRRIRMELEGLSLQLNQSDESTADDGMTQLIPPPVPVFNALTGTRAQSNSVLAVSSAGAIFRLDESLENSSPLIYFDRRNSQSIINGNSWSGYANNDDDLPGYESIVCILDSSHQPSDNSAIQQGEESPPPSYNDVVHLYSFTPLDAKRK